MKISYYSLGCKVNLYECESIVNQFLDRGFELGKFNEPCDVYLINTCSVTEVADAKSRKIIRQAIKQNNNGLIVVMGCYAQLKPEDIKAIEGVDVLIGTTNRHEVYNLVMKALKEKTIFSCVDDVMSVREYEEIKMNRINDKTRGFVKIEDGCDNYCSYCTIPYARGHVKSRKPENVINELQQLTDDGVKEIVLAGINTGHYGKDLADYDFNHLLIDICENVKGLGRLRISSIEMTEITEDLLKTMKKYQKHFCNQIHLPIQGACDKTLKRMHRKYILNEYIEKVNLIRSFFPDINITTDIMAGFSGETDEDFDEAIKNVLEIGFGEMHVFPYSRRPRTVAFKYDGIVSPQVKKQRVNKLLEINKIQALKYRNKFKDKTVEVLIEKEVDGKLFGHSSNYIEVLFEGTAKVNEFATVKLTNIDYPICEGVEINEIR